MLMVERDHAGRRWQCAAAAVALLLVKEDMGLLVAGFGIYLLTRRGERRRAAAYVVAGLAWTWLATRVLIPEAGGAADYYWAYGALGPDLPHAAAHVLTHPWSVPRLLVTPHVKVRTMLWLAAPLLLLPLASPLTLSVLPLLAERMLASKFGHWWEPRFHYNVALTAVLVAAGVDGAVRLRRLRADRVWPVAALVATVAIVPHFALGSLFDRNFYRRDTRARAAAAAVAAVPSGTLVEATNDVGPWLSGRTRVLLWDDRPRWAPWVVADVSTWTFPFTTLRGQRERVRLLLDSGYTIVRQEGGFVVLTKPRSVPDLRRYR
jgi:hypothetical protein